MQTTFRSLFRQTEKALAEAGVPDAASDTELLMEEYLGIDRGRYYLAADDVSEINEEKYAQFTEALSKRCQRIPLQYILGWTEFMGLRFSVDERVLIPRQDTETLVETVLSQTKGLSGLTLLDLCTGSGCIAVSLAASGRFAGVSASDLSHGALCLAERNASANKVKVEFLEGDLFEPVKGRYDVITANPPYIPRKVIEGLEPEVRDFEPNCALDGGEDGLSFYRRIIGEANRYLKPQGALYLEIGYDQAEEVTELLRAHGFCGVSVVKDLGGNFRVAVGKMKNV